MRCSWCMLASRIISQREHTTMPGTPQILQAPATADEAHPGRPLPPLIPLQAVWASLTPSQQQRLFHQLVRLCCGLLRLDPEGRCEETHDDAP